MDEQALEELITLFLKLNPNPSDQQFHALAEAVGVDHETLESISYKMLGEAEDLLEEPISASLIHRINASARVHADSEDVLDDPAKDPDDLSLQDVALNDGDPTDDDLGMQEETFDDGYTEDDVGVGLTNNVSDVLTDDGIPIVSLP
jgi:hypothetical protein